MKIIRIDKKDWPGGIKRLARTYRLYGPVKGDKYHSFQPIDDQTLPDFSFTNTRMPPKSLVQPQSEVMFEYHLDETRDDHHILKELRKSDRKTALIGVRPCDAAAYLLVKKNFDTKAHRDPYWVDAYEAMTRVGLACGNPCQSCFCTTAGCGPFHEDGLDVLLVETPDRLLAKCLTQKGDTFLNEAGWGETEDPDAADREIASLKGTAEKRIASTITTDRLKSQTTTDLYEAPFWEDVSFSCINCGTCTFVCPTCWCFDIQDENYGMAGVRMRNWDSCMFPLFTLHGSGHNPRGTKLHRVRQRFMHKLKYYVDKYDNGIQCVGCGRCVTLCPVNIDIRRACNLMNDYET